MDKQQTPVKSKDGYFQCGFCKRHYNRADHLIRHVRSHTREKPYICDVCDKGFARPDLLKRHATGHLHDRDSKRRRSSTIKQSRVSQACKTCAASKLKCDEEKPCKRCRQRKLPCDWQEVLLDSPQEPAHSQLDTPDTQMIMDPSLEMATPTSFPTAPAPMDLLPNGGTLTGDSHEPILDLAPSPSVQTADSQNPMDFTVSQTDHESGIFSIDGTFFPDFIPDSLIPFLGKYNDPFDPSSLIPEFTHYGALESPTLDFSLTDGDLGLIDLYNSQDPSSYLKGGDPQDSYDAESDVGMGLEAYHRSSLSAWTPVQGQDRAFDDHENLSVPEAIDSPKVISDQQILSEKLSSSSRDMIFGLVLEISKEASMSRIMRTFPSTDLLNRLLQQYFENQHHNIVSFIHAPTFRPNNEHPSVLAALASAGAVRSSIPAIRKLGYALMEIVRLFMPVKYENDNSTTRDLRTSQTYALNIDIGIWSGNRRKTEIAESFAQPLITMLRRGLRFRRSMYTTIFPSSKDNGVVLETKWLQWIEQESFKRLVYHIFIHDAQTAATLNVNPLISYADLELPLPAPRALWEAQTAFEWKRLYLELTPSRTPSLADVLRDMSTFSLSQTQIDSQFAAIVLLHGLSALINEYHRLKFISPANSKHWHALVINSRQQELDKALQHFRMVISEVNSASQPEIKLTYEVVSMLLYMSPEELQLFAGKEDKQEARRVYHSALEWIGSSDSRMSIWHAGQVIRAAREMPLASLTGFVAIGIYYASLAFWSYGVVSKAQSSKIGIGHISYVPSEDLTVFLDGEDEGNISKFVTLGCGFPAIQGPGGPVLLADTGPTMQAIRQILRPETSESTPQLVQSLAQLMGDLGNCVHGT